MQNVGMVIYGYLRSVVGWSSETTKIGPGAMRIEPLGHATPNWSNPNKVESSLAEFKLKHTYPWTASAMEDSLSRFKIGPEKPKLQVIKPITPKDVTRPETASALEGENSVTELNQHVTKKHINSLPMLWIRQINNVETKETNVKMVGGKGNKSLLII